MLLPFVDAAREEHAELLRCLQSLVDSIDATGLTPQVAAAKAIIERSSASAEAEAA